MDFTPIPADGISAIIFVVGIIIARKFRGSALGVVIMIIGVGFSIVARM